MKPGSPGLEGTSAGFSMGVLGFGWDFFLPILLSTDSANGKSFVFNPRDFILALSPPNAHAAYCSPPLIPLIDLYRSSRQRKLPEKSKP